MFDPAFFATAFVTLFSVVDPISIVPMFLVMTADESPARRNRFARNATLAATGVLLFFLAFGQAVFSLFSITLFAFRIAGGVILLIIALDLLKATHTSVRVDPAEREEGRLKNDISITPLGIPMLGGPGAISTVMVLSSQRPGAAGSGAVAAAILLVGVTIYVSLRAADLVQRVMGVTGINVVSRLLGLLLLAMAVQFILEGVRDAVPFVTGG